MKMLFATCFISENITNYTLLQTHTPAGGTARPLSLFVIPCTCKRNTTLCTDPVEKQGDINSHPLQ